MGRQMAASTSVDVDVSGSGSAMAPSTLDLLVVSFNCAKHLVDVGVFASHLGSALGQNATGLPDLVALSLQEIAPLSQSFIGDYFLNPYFARFDEAVNLAAARHDGAQPRDAESATSPPGEATAAGSARRRPYTLLRAHNVGYTAVMLFARDPARVRDLHEAEVGFGAAEMGNKGAVGLRVLYDAGDGESTELTFVATHLAAMEWNLPRRNANWAAIMRGLTFENPEAVLDRMRNTGGSDDQDGSGDGDDSDEAASPEQHRLLHDEHHRQHRQLQRQLHDISVFKPSSHLFVAGDLNYRTSTTSPPPDAAFPSLDPVSEHYYPAFFALDQLTRERAAGRTMHGLTEHEVRFPPTYKYVVQPAGSGRRELETELDVPWKFAPHRYPSWTDRVLYLDVPPWLKARRDPPRIQVRAYDALPVVRTSDHRPVFLRADVPVIAPGDMAPRDGDAAADPRARLPVEIDPEAWERRKAARQKERLVGWTMFLWSTKEGALILTALLVAGLGGYWLYLTAS